MSRHRISRRAVIRTGAVMAAARLVSPARGALGANDRLRVGIIGPGDRGRDLLKDFFAHCSAYNAELVAVCDLWSLRREQGEAFVTKHAGKKPATFRNPEEMYDAMAVDAVIVATPDFSHARVCAAALRAGKDVYVEKPLAHTLEDAKFVRKACRETGGIVQVGTQGRSDAHMQAAARFVQSGQFGAVTSVEACMNVNQPGRWRRAELVARVKESDTDWGRYLQNLPKAPFDARHYVEFRLFWPYSSGLPDQWMSHQIDGVHFVTGQQFPKTCVASGGIYQWRDGRENPDTFGAIFEYPGGFQVRYTARQNNSFNGLKEYFFSTRGTLDAGKAEVLADGGVGKKEGGPAEKLESVKLPVENAQHHMANWLQCVRERKQPAAHIDAGFSHSVAVCMAIIAMQTGKRTSFNADRQEIETA